MRESRVPRPKVTMVWTRKLDGEPMAGRIRVALEIRAALRGCADLTEFRLPTMITQPSPMRLAQSLFAWLASAVRGPLLPIQCALFASLSDQKALVAALPPEVESIYLDGVRSYALLAHLRKRRPDIRIVVDLDDLMSRRMALLLWSGEPLSPGYLTKHLPGIVLGLVMSKAIGELIVRYELWTLKVIEREIAMLADTVVLLSSEDARILRLQCAGLAPMRANIEVIPPGIAEVSPPRPLTGPIRFVFVGSDALTQNRLTIDYLVALWRRHAFDTPLVLFGFHSRRLDLPASVSVAGYVEHISEIFDGRSVLLTPSKIGGGVKTKVLEAFANGAAVVGNALTFESMPIGDYPLNIAEEADLVELLANPDQHRARFDEAAQVGVEYLRACHDRAVFGYRWRSVMLGAQKHGVEG